MSMATLFAVLFANCKEKEIEEEDSEATTSDTTDAEIVIVPKVIEYCPGYSQFIGERFLTCETKEAILSQCTEILSSNNGDITLGGLGGYLTIDLGTNDRSQDYTFRFNGNGFDDNYCLVSASTDGKEWIPLNAPADISTVTLSYVQNTTHNRYSWRVDTIKNCRKVGVKEICNTKITYDWDSTAIWSKVINGEERAILPHSNGTPLLYIRAHQGPYFNDLLGTPTGLAPQVSHTLCDSFVVRSDVRYLKFQNAFDSISPITGEFSPEINNLSVLF